MRFWISLLFTTAFAGMLCAQQEMHIDAVLNPAEKSITIAQKVVFTNTSNQPISEIHFFDWAHSFSSKTTPLAVRFAEEYDDRIHFEREEERGNTSIENVTGANATSLSWRRGDDAQDIFIISLSSALAPGATTTLDLKYTVTLPDSKFTRYGADRNGNFYLRYWYVVPAVLKENGAWNVYSNKDSDDLYFLPTDVSVAITFPKKFNLFSELNTVSSEEIGDFKKVLLEGKKRNHLKIQIVQNPTDFESIVTDRVEVVTSVKDNKVGPAQRALIVDRVVQFLHERLGEYPFDKIQSTDQDYRNNPVYGLNQLPNFISPFPSGFEHDLEQFKTLSGAFLENTLIVDKRSDYWLKDAIQIKLMQDYVDTYYPKMKLIGDLSNWFVIRWAHLADIEFNDQYPLLYMNMARNNIHQKLTTPKDSLLKFNKNIANEYYGGQGLMYLQDYLDSDILQQTILNFYATHTLQEVKSSQFEEALAKKTDLPINWFFEDYVDKRRTIDFKIKKVTVVGDSLRVVIKNNRDTKLPVSVYGLDKNKVVFKQWTAPVDSVTTVTVPRDGVRKLALNYEQTIPEFNQRNNYKAVKGLLNKPIQFRLFQDIEDPAYSQLFFMPIVEYNLYDGISTGVKLYNKTLLPKGMQFKFEPQYGFGSNTLVGSGSVRFTQLFEGNRPFSARYGISGNYYSYDDDLFYRRFTPYVTLAFRPKDLRDNEKQYINLRSVNVNRDADPNNPDQEPNYSVLNASYVYSNPNLINYFRGVVDFEISSKFSKISTTFSYRKLFLNNRQLNVRAFAGTFIKNNTRDNGDFFSFALDRPTDYLFDYNYYGRSEDTGVFSQQLIVAEGGFKSQLEPAFANSWMATVNTSTTIWKWIQAYGDAGLVHNRGEGTRAVFDSGIRLNLVADYFELYFPVYSSLGWEPGLSDYDQRIRFVVTLSPRTLLSLFTRKWY